MFISPINDNLLVGKKLLDLMKIQDRRQAQC